MQTMPQCTGDWSPFAGRRPALGTANAERSARPKAGTGLHWGHVGVPGCRPKAGAGWAEGPSLRRAQCARDAVSSACVRRAAQQYKHPIYTATGIYEY